MATVAQVLQDCHMFDLIRVAWFLEEHERCTFICPEGDDDSQDEWILAIAVAALQRRTVNTVTSYIARIKEIVRANPAIRDFTNIRFTIEDENDLMGEIVNDNYNLNNSNVEDDEGQDVVGIYDDISPTPSEIVVDEEATDETRGLECKICTVNKICVVLAKCGHVFCNSCTTRFENQCAVCRTPFTDETKIRMYI